MKDVVIYRSGCEASKNLLNKLMNLPLANELAFYSVDPDPVTKKRNVDLIKILEINYTPTVYFAGKKFEGKAVFDWVEAMMNAISQPLVDQPNGSMRLPTPQVTTSRAQGGQQRGPPPPSSNVPNPFDSYTPVTADGAMFAQGSMDMFTFPPESGRGMDPNAFALHIPESTRTPESSMDSEDLYKRAQQLAAQQQAETQRRMERA